MITKIISGGQTGADRGALDAAIRLEMDHGGWIPKGRLAEDGPLADTYRLLEMPTDAYLDRTEKNIVVSDGTLIISYGSLRGGSKLTRKLAEKHKKWCLQVDLSDTPIFLAASNVCNWIFKNTIKVLNVTGPRASKEPEIYKATFYVVKGVLLLNLVKSGAEDRINDDDVKEYFDAVLTVPETVDEAVNVLLLTLDKETMEIFASRTQADLKHYYNTAGALISKEFKLQEGNEKLLESCRKFVGQPDLNAKGASIIILEIFWHSLGHTRH